MWTVGFSSVLLRGSCEPCAILLRPPEGSEDRARGRPPSVQSAASASEVPAIRLPTSFSCHTGMRIRCLERNDHTIACCFQNVQFSWKPNVSVALYLLRRTPNSTGKENFFLHLSAAEDPVQLMAGYLSSKAAKFLPSCFTRCFKAIKYIFWYLLFILFSLKLKVSCKYIYNHFCLWAALRSSSKWDSAALGRYLYRFLQQLEDWQQNLLLKSMVCWLAVSSITWEIVENAESQPPTPTPLPRSLELESAFGPASQVTDADNQVWGAIVYSRIWQSLMETVFCPSWCSGLAAQEKSLWYPWHGYWHFFETPRMIISSSPFLELYSLLLVWQGVSLKEKDKIFGFPLLSKKYIYIFL